MEKVIVMIDGNYLRMGAKKIEKKHHIDHQAFVTKLITEASKIMEESYKLLRTYYYDAPPLLDRKVLRANEINFARKRQVFLDSLNRLTNFEVVLGRIQYKGRDKDGYLITTQKGVDVRMAIDLIEFAEQGNVGALILVTGDSDLIPAIRAAKRKGVNVILAMFEHAKSNLIKELVNSADAVIKVTGEMLPLYTSK